MRKTKHYALLLIVALAMFSCGDDYDDTALKNDISDLKSRVEKLESWCSTANTQISALQGLISALQENDYVTGVNPIMEGAKEVGYTITFAKSKLITILNGKDGENGTDGITPIISVKQDTDGVYYWTVTTGDADPVWMTDAEGKKINAAGQAGEAGHTPLISVETSDGKLCWKVDGKWLLDEKGNKVPATGEKGATGATGASGSNGSKGDQGDSIFKEGGIDYDENKDYVIFTLTDGTEIKLMRALDVTISIKDVEDEMYITTTESSKETELVLPPANDYKAITAEIKSKQGVHTAIATRATTEGPELWEVELTKPVLEDEKVITPGKVKITPSSSATKGDQAILTLSIIDKQNIEHTTVIIITYTDEIPVTKVTLDEKLALNVGERQTLTAIVFPDNAADKTVTWSSSDESIATVSNTGEVEGVKAGTTTITVTSTKEGKTAQCEVTVSNVSVKGVTLDATATVSIKGTTTLKPVFTPENATIQTGTWKSNNTSIATVNNTGVVTGVAIGTVAISFTSTDGNIRATCMVTVNATTPVNYDWYLTPDDATNNSYKISTKEEFIGFAKIVNHSSDLPANVSASDFRNKTINLSADLDLGTQTWIPIGNRTNSFDGHFNGNNHKITGSLTMPATGYQELGIFGYIYKTAVIENLRFEGTMDVSAVSEEKYEIGTIVGNSEGTIIHCSNTANLVNNDHEGWYIGGIVGMNNASIVACINKGSIEGKARIGGIAGMSGGKIIGCINKGDSMKADGTEYNYAGGISSGVGGSTSNPISKACWSTASTIIAKGTARISLGGIAGRLIEGKLANCYWKAITGLYAAGSSSGGNTSNCASFSGNAPSKEQISSMNSAWQTEDSNRKFQFNADTGEIEAIPAP